MRVSFNLMGNMRTFLPGYTPSGNVRHIAFHS